MESAEKTISVRDLTKNYANRPVVDGLSFDVHRGEIFGLVGPDDSGKTTLLRMITGILSPSLGSIHILGNDISQTGDAVIPEIGYLAQVFSLYSDLTIKENLDFFGNVFMIPEMQLKKRQEELLEFSNLKQFQKRLAGKLSGGMKKKLSVICALLHSPQILIMDEPTIGVDPVTRRELWRMFYALRREGITILVSTSYMDEAELCTRMGYIYCGRMIMIDTPKNIKENFKASVLHITGQPRNLIKTILQNLPGSPFWAPFGMNFHLYDETGKLPVETLRTFFKQPGCEEVFISQVPVSIEDVFVKNLHELQVNGVIHG